MQEKRIEGKGKIQHTMLRLTRRTMTQLAIQRLLATKLVLDAPTVAIRLVEGLELVVGLMDPVRRALLPLAEALGLAGAGLLLYGAGLTLDVLLALLLLLDLIIVHAGEVARAALVL